MDAIPGRRVIGQYLLVEQIDEIVSTQLADSEWAKNFFDLVNDPILVTDSSGNIIMVNEAFARLRGVDKSELLGCNVRSFSPPSKIVEVLETRKTVYGLSQRDDGKEYMVEIRPVLRDDVLLGTIMSAKDISALDRLPSRSRDATHLELNRFMDIVGRSLAIRALKSKATTVALTELTVLILGETGTGKELLARAVHEAGPRSNRPFVAINCASFPEGLIDSELFGHEEGAFTGARRGGKMGLIEAANGGTLFLDEIGDMPLEFQPRLLRVIENGVVRKVGSTRDFRVDIRLIAATNRPLDDLVRQGKFRVDLYYRLAGVTLKVPPLRDRTEDIPDLASHFLAEFRSRTGRIARLTPSALAALRAYSWPGNVRELRNVVLGCAYQSADGVIRRSDLPEPISMAIPEGGPLSMRKDAMMGFLRSKGFITNRDYCYITGVDRTTAFRDLSHFCAAGLIRPCGQGRSRRYVLTETPH